jgi:zinc protease
MTALRRCVLALPMFLPAALSAQKAATRAVTAADVIPLDSLVRVGRLPNGLRYYVRKNGRPEKRLELRLVVNAGSVLEDEDQRGLAHFTEHMLFNGTQRYKKNDIVNYLESIGVKFGADLNAFTGFDETVYILPVPSDKPELVEKGLDILQEWASAALFDSTDVLGERGVVLEEWRGGLGAGTRIRDKQFPVIFKGSKYAERLPIGIPEIIRGANPGPLKRFYREWYRPDLMAVVAVGDADPLRVERLIRERFSKLTRPVGARARPAVPVPPNEQTLVSIATDPEQQVSTLYVLYKRPSRTERLVSDYRRSLVGELYNFMLNQRLSEIARKPDAPFSVASSSYGGFVRATDVYQLVATVKDGGLVKGLEAVLTEARRVDQHGFLPAELDRAKATTLRAYESAYAERDKSESADYVSEYLAHYLTGDPSPGISWEYRQVQRILPTVTLTEVNALGREWISDRNRVVAVAAPEKAGVAVPTEAELLRVFGTVDGATVAAWTETVSDAPLVGEKPATGAIASESRVDELGMTEWTLSNGVRVLLKPTTFKADEVLMRAWSPGGSSLVPDADVPSATLATTVVERGGVATFNAIELNKKLSGKQASVSPFIDDVSQGFSGRASPKDLETLFQLVYLKFVAPRRDEAAFNAFKSQVAPFFANRANNPEATFSDTILVTMAQHHPRARPISQPLLDDVKYSRAFEIYKERFADASGMTFLFVGSFTLEAMRPLVEKWLAVLPSKGRKETWRDVGVRSPTGVIERTVRQGVEPKAQSLVLFTGTVDYTPETRYALRSLGEYLEMRLLENLREALGGTYSVGVSGQVSKYPLSEYTVSVSFGSAPERTDSLFGTVMAVIDSTKAGNITASDVEKIREQQQRTMEVSVKENGYWLGNISARLENGEDPRGLLKYGDFIKGLSADQIRDAARRFLDAKNYARFTLLPARPTTP